MSDLGWYLACALGFALMCVIGVVWMLSKRSVHVTQVQENHAAPVTVHAGESGGGGLYPALVGGMFKLLMAGFVLAAIIYGVQALGNGLQSVGNGLSQQAQPKPQQIVVNYPTAVPMPTAAPVSVPASVPQYVPQAVPVTADIDLTGIVVVVLAIAAASLWGYVGVTLWRRRSIKRPSVISGPRNVSAREVFGVQPDVKTKETVRR